MIAGQNEQRPVVLELGKLQRIENGVLAVVAAIEEVATTHHGIGWLIVQLPEYLAGSSLAAP